MATCGSKVQLKSVWVQLASAKISITYELLGQYLKAWTGPITIAPGFCRNIERSDWILKSKVNCTAIRPLECLWSKKATKIDARTHLGKSVVSVTKFALVFHEYHNSIS